MKIKGFGTKPKMKVTVKKGVRIEIRDIDLQFDHFDFFLDRHKFPKVKDTGVGEVSCKCWCYLAFEIKLDEDKNMTVDKFRANVTIDELPMGIIKCNHKKVFKTLLKMFQKKGKEGVQDEIRKKTQENIAMISDKVRKRVFLRCHLYIYKRSFYQDRLATNIGEALKKGRFSQVAKVFSVASSLFLGTNTFNLSRYRPSCVCDTAYSLGDTSTLLVQDCNKSGFPR